MNYKSTLKFLMAASLLCASVEAMAVPAKPGKLAYTLPNGETISVYLHGDESAHYYTTEDGHVLTQDNEGFFRYVTTDKNGVNKMSDVVATNLNKRNSQETLFVKSLEREKILKNLEVEHHNAFSGRQSKVATKGITTFPTTGVQKGVAILVEFADNSFTLSNPQQQFYNQLNQRGYSDSGATGSIRDYYTASSNGVFVPEFDVYGPVKLEKSISYYGGDSNRMTDENAPEMVIDACTKLDGQIDFTQYDRDNDGVIDNVYIFYAGYGQADGGAASTVWPHSWDVRYAGRTFYYDGKRLGHYACSSELRDGRGSKISGIGVFCHEFAHVLGLPDLYATSYTGAFTPNAWSLLDSGSYNNDSWTPPYLSVYERADLGWVTPIVLEDPDNITMKAISDGGYREVYKIKTNKENEYFLLENRQKGGVWDEYLPGHGMLVWHIDYNQTIWEGNVVNNTPSHQYVDIEEADNDPSYYSYGGDPFPGDYNVTSFTDNTAPSMKTWAGVSLNSPITEISETADGIISFVFRGGYDKFGEVKANEATNIGADKATVSWGTAENATSYLVSVYEEKANGDKTYVGDYNHKNVGNVLTAEITGLYPLTTYYYVVYATDGMFSSKASNEVEFTTGEPTLNYKKVKALAATNVTKNGFTANWEKLEDADRYTLTVYTSQLGAPEYELLDFTGKLEALPSSWKTSCTGTYALKTMCGVSAPSLKMDADQAYLQSPVFNKGVRTLSFWYRGNNADASNSLKILALCDGTWEVIHEETTIENATGGKIVTLDIDRKYTSLKWVYVKPCAGNIAIDDIKIGHSGEMEDLPLAGYVDMEVGNVNSYKVEGLMEGVLYAYSVIAHNSEFSSNESNRVSVTPGSSSAIDDVNNSESAICWANNGKLYVKANVEAQVIVFDCAGKVLLNATQDVELQSYDFDVKGIVIVKVNNIVRKLVL